MDSVIIIMIIIRIWMKSLQGSAARFTTLLSNTKSYAYSLIRSLHASIKEIQKK